MPITIYKIEEGRKYKRERLMFIVEAHQYIGLVEHFIWVFLYDVMKNPNEVFDQPNNLNLTYLTK